jgi:hypothetical protein
MKLASSPGVERETTLEERESFPQNRVLTFEKPETRTHPTILHSPVRHSRYIDGRHLNLIRRS